jgi:lysophospholipase L1-like esterase
MDAPLARISARLILFFCGLAFAEAALQLVAAIEPAVGDRLTALKPRYVADARLDVRGDRTLAEYDEAGFRNERRPSRPHFVAIGDSQTEGSGVARSNAWPQQLGRITGTDVYQMAFGGYGPGHYLTLVEDALSMQPEVVVVAVYTGNDLVGMYEWVYEKNRNPELASEDPNMREVLARAERGHGPIDQPWRATRDAQRGLYGVPALGWIRTQLDERVKLVALYDQVRWRMSARSGVLDDGTSPMDAKAIERVVAASPSELLFPVAYHDVRTVLTPSARAAAQNLDDPRIAEGLRMTLAALERMAKRVMASGARFLVVLVPTKEAVVAETIRRSPGQRDMEPAARTVAEREADIHRTIEAFLTERDVAWVSALVPLADALDAAALDAEETSESPYPPSWDGHPTRAGHAAIARTVAGALSRPPWSGWPAAAACSGASARPDTNDPRILSEAPVHAGSCSASSPTPHHDRSPGTPEAPRT